MKNLFAVLQKIEYAEQLLDKLESGSSDLDWKVCNVVKEVDNLRCGFDSLKEDVTVLESASSELLTLTNEIGTCLEEHSEQTESDISNILDSVDSKKETANAIEGLVHPCGGPGWKQVEFSDFRDRDTSCPMPDLVQLMRDLTHAKLAQLLL